MFSFQMNQSLGPSKNEGSKRAFFNPIFLAQFLTSKVFSKHYGGEQHRDNNLYFT
jgi:hypothetical protein